MIKIGLRSGGCLRLDDKTVDTSEVQLSDMVWGIAGEQRFSNQLDRTYSVAEHTIHLSNLVTDKTDYDTRIAALFHESEEAFGIRDVHYQLKTKDFKKLGNRIRTAICEKFGAAEWKDVELDRQLGNHECLTFHPAKGQYAETPMPAFRVPYYHWTKEDAKKKWDATYDSYLTGRTFLAMEWNLPTNLRPGLPFSLHQVASQLRGVPIEAVAKKLTTLGCRETKPGEYVL